MKQTLNYTDRHDLFHKNINIERKDTGILFGIPCLEDFVEQYDFSKNDHILLFAQDKLCTEIIEIGTIQDVLQLPQSKTYPVQDTTILRSHDLSIDVHIVGTDRKIKSRTDKIYLGKGNKPRSKNNIPFDIDTKDIDNKIFEIGSEDDNIICFISEKIAPLKDNLKDKSSLEFALLGPIILKEAFTYALITNPDSTGDNLEYWQQCLLKHIDKKKLPDAEQETAELIKIIDEFAHDFTAKNKLQNILNEHYQGDTDV